MDSVQGQAGVWRTTGHDRTVGILRRGLAQGRLSHAYLIAGPGHVGKMTLAIDVAMAVCCTEEQKPCGACAQCTRVARGLHTDVRVVSIEGGEKESGRGRVLIGIDQVRQVQREASLTPFEGSHRVIIFDGAERLSEEAANSLLKFLEEPPDQVVLLLLASDAAALPATVVSRCQLLELRPVPADVIARALAERYELDSVGADEIARLAEGRPGWAFLAAEDGEVLAALSRKLDVIEDVVGGTLEGRFAYAAGLASAFERDRESAREELELWKAWWRSVLLVKEDLAGFVVHTSRLGSLEQVAASLSDAQAAHAMEAVSETAEHLERNVSPRLALEELMLALPRTGAASPGGAEERR